MKKTMVLCTDNWLAYELLWGPLQSAGWETLSAANSREALGHCAWAHPELLLVDLDWPLERGGDSGEVARRALRIKPQLPIIVISGRKDLIRAAESLGVAAVARKPIDVPALLRTAEELVAAPDPAGGEEHEDRDVAIRRLAPNPEAFREALRQRANAPFQVAGQSGHFGLNE